MLTRWPYDLNKTAGLVEEAERCVPGRVAERHDIFQVLQTTSQVRAPGKRTKIHLKARGSRSPIFQALNKRTIFKKQVETISCITRTSVIEYW